MNDNATQPALLSRRAMLGGLTSAIELAGVGSLLAGCSNGSGGVVSTSPTISQTATTVVSTPTPVPIGTILFEYRSHSSLAMAVGWSPDGGRIVSGGFDNTAQAWDAETGNQVYCFDPGNTVIVWVAA
jgi:WD40 repeat protein